MHKGLFHALLNVVALTPLMERFESEYGTLSSVALFIGRECAHAVLGDSLLCAALTTTRTAFSTIPALLYVFIERGILRVDNAVMGAR